jgi:hypothetical protein
MSSKAKSSQARKKNPQKSPSLGPGLHAGHIELQSEERYQIRTLTGETFQAVLGDDVEPALAEECLRASRMVILCDTQRGPTIVGALQTSRSLVREPDGTISIEGKAIHLRAEQGVRIESGPVSLTLNKKGTMRAEGNKMVIDMGSNVRVYSALVELPLCQQLPVDEKSQPKKVATNMWDRPLLA